jgi:hypothetical protein
VGEAPRVPVVDTVGGVVSPGLAPASAVVAMVEVKAPEATWVQRAFAAVAAVAEPSAVAAVAAADAAAS